MWWEKSQDPIIGYIGQSESERKVLKKPKETKWEVYTELANKAREWIEKFRCQLETIRRP